MRNQLEAAVTGVALLHRFQDGVRTRAGTKYKWASVTFLLFVGFMRLLPFCNVQRGGMGTGLIELLSTIVAFIGIPLCLILARFVLDLSAALVSQASWRV